MDLALITALQAPAPRTALLVTVSLPDHTVRLTDGGFVVWDGETWAVEDATYGFLGALGEVEDGADTEATVWSVEFLCDMDAIMALSEPEVQGSAVTLHLASVSEATGLLIGEPELLFRGELDQPRLGVSESLSLIYDCITEEARLLEVNEERRQNDSFHQSIWPGELGYEHVTDLPLKDYWRSDDPTGAIS